MLIRKILHMLIRRSFFIFITLTLTAVLQACGGGGGGGSSTNSTSNPTVAAQVQDISPSNDQDTVSVFVALDSTTSVSAVLTGASEQEQRTERQADFLARLQNASRSPVGGVSGNCTATDLAARIQQAHSPSSGDTVRIDLNACELNLLPKLKGVNGVHADIPLTTQTAPITNADLTKTIDAVKMSFDGQTAFPVLNGNTANGQGKLIALLDSGVEANHPALGSSKVLNGVCFSTASNGGIGFCPNGQNIDMTSTNAARSCVDAWSGTRNEALQAGCGHGTAMAGAMGMNYNVSGVTAQGVAPNVQILPVQVFSQSITSSGKSLSASSGDLLAGIEWVTREAQRRRNAGSAPIVAMNLSLGGGSYTSTCDNEYVGSLFKNAFANLRAQGVLPIVAAGNGGTLNAVSFPACVSNTVQVSAAKLGYNGLASYSNFSTQTKVIAVGGDVDGTGRYLMPMVCATSGTYDCWQAVAGTSPATALVSGGVAALYSVKPNSSLSEVESALTTDIAALNLTGSSAIHLTVNDGSQSIIRPALRLTASANRLWGTSESGGSSSTSTPITNDTTISLAQICIYARPNFAGSQACALQGYGVNVINKDLFYRYDGKIGSIRITFPRSNTNLANGIATVTIYPALTTSSLSGSVSLTNANTVQLTGANNPTIRMIRIQTQ